MTDILAAKHTPVKSDSYKTMNRLSETIRVRFVYYTKSKTGLTIEVEE